MVNNLIDAKKVFHSKREYDAIRKSINKGKKSGYHVNLQSQIFKDQIQKEITSLRPYVARAPRVQL